MPPTVVTYELGRLNFITAFEAGLDFILTGLAGSEPLGHRDSLWSFTDVETVDEGGDLFVVGYLVKYRSQAAEEVVDTLQHKLTTDYLANAVRAKSRFVLHVETHIIAFHPVAREIPRTLFRQMFADLFRAGHHNFMVDVELQMIQQEQRTLLETLPRFERLVRVQILLHPSNPSNSERWRKVDEALRARNAQTYREVLTTPLDKGGLQVADDSEIRAKIAMAQDGYGEAEARGVLDGKLKTITTQTQPVTAELPTDDLATPQEVASRVRDLIQKLRERFR
jgi:hypothetical protein